MAIQSKRRRNILLVVGIVVLVGILGWMFLTKTFLFSNKSAQQTHSATTKPAKITPSKDNGSISNYNSDTWSNIANKADAEHMKAENASGN